ncbi:MAG: TM2 domain-containing protein [Acetobacter sp.]|nr:TM2 domain-containing protein [Bacteroides sp.]MCM1341668.1 TM2 domain-containing protein [Acetobacter sp.]MCM1434283.1 TM2 domain-containing protein [Clostridiales bacterium]
MYCTKCGAQIDDASVICTHCGVPTQNYQQNTQAQHEPVINVINNNTNTVVAGGKAKNKWVSLLLCFFLGFLGAHKFYEGKIGMGILYIFTCGLCGIGALVDFFFILFKSNPYYV